MKLHRAGKKPEWEKVAVRQRNAWQRLAAGSSGVVTPGNFFSLAGLALVMAGLGIVVVAGRSGTHNVYFGWALGLIVVGRVCDLLDGWLADRTGTKSPLGEKLDAGIDKLVTLLALPALWAGNLLTWWSVVLLAMPHLAIASIAIYKMRRGHGMPHPSRAGKLSMAAMWLTLSLVILFFALPPYAKAVAYLALVSAVTSIILGSVAAIGYSRHTTD